MEDGIYFVSGHNNRKIIKAVPNDTGDGFDIAEEYSVADVYDQFGVSGGTPYYITEIDGRYYMAHHRTSENIIAFDVRDDHIEAVEVIY